MNERDGDAPHTAFQELLGARPEPPLPSVVEAAVTGGRRIRRRRVALAAASTATAGLAEPAPTGAQRSGDR